MADLRSTEALVLEAETFLVRLLSSLPGACGCPRGPGTSSSSGEKTLKTS